MTFHRDLQQGIDHFLLDCARNNYEPPAIIKAHWAREQLAYLNEMIEALEVHDLPGVHHYRKAEQTSPTVRRLLGEYLEERLSRPRVRELMGEVYREAENYFRERGFDASLAPELRSARSPQHQRPRRRKSYYYTHLETLIQKGKK